ncbi:unnamed protein product, partial [Protopolystoma xenopodis]
CALILLALHPDPLSFDRLIRLGPPIQIPSFRSVHFTPGAISQGRLGDNLMEVINIVDYFPEETKREIEMELIPNILTHHEPTHRNIFAVRRKTLDRNEQLVLQADKGGASVIIDKKTIY